jgi:hypothetical protein
MKHIFNMKEPPKALSLGHRIKSEKRATGRKRHIDHIQHNINATKAISGLLQTEER